MLLLRGIKIGVISFVVEVVNLYIKAGLFQLRLFFRKLVQKKPSYVKKRTGSQRLTCSRRCMGVLRKSIFLGRDNPNCKYNLDDNFFEIIDAREKAYVLGWIGSDGHVACNKIEIGIKDVDVDILNKIRDIVCREIPVVARNGKVFLTFNSTKMVADVCKWLRIFPGKKDKIVRMPFGIDFTWDFIRGYFDGDGTIRNPFKKRSLDCGIASYSEGMKEDIKVFCKIPCTVSDGVIYFYTDSAISFLDKMYENTDLYLNRKHDYYIIWKDRYKDKI